MSNDSRGVVRAQKRKKAFAVERFGGKCTVCGYSKCLAALEFHHVDNKEEAPSYVIYRWSWKRAKKELKKCILVCANCHREIHHEESDISFRVVIKPWLKTQCKCCLLEFDTKNESQKYCCQRCRETGSRKTGRPPKEELMKLISDKIPWVLLGQRYGISDNGVRKWARAYDIQWEKRKYKLEDNKRTP